MFGSGLLSEFESDYITPRLLSIARNKPMMIECPCPGCGRKLNVPAVHAGRSGLCKFCKSRFTVPKAPEPSPENEPKLEVIPEPVPSSPVYSLDDDVEDLPIRRGKRKKPWGMILGGVAVLLSVVALCVVLFRGGSREGKPATEKPAADVNEFTSAEGRFKVWMPGTPKESTVNSPQGSLKIYLLELKADQRFSVIFGDDPNRNIDSEANRQKALDTERDDLLKLANSTLKKESKITLNGKYPGREIEITTSKKDSLLRARFYLVDQRFYALTVAGTQSFISSEDASKFLNSLVLTSGSTTDSPRLALGPLPDPKRDGVEWTHRELLRFFKGAGLSIFLDQIGRQTCFVLANTQEEVDDLKLWCSQLNIPESPAVSCRKFNTEQLARDWSGKRPSLSFSWGLFVFEGYRKHFDDPTPATAQKDLDKLHRALTGKPFNPN